MSCKNKHQPKPCETGLIWRIPCTIAFLSHFPNLYPKSIFYMINIFGDNFALKQTRIRSIMKYSCLTADSIRLMAEASGVQEPSLEVAATISEDATFRLRLIIGRAIKFMRHANRTKLTCADINRSLKWSDCQPVFGHECKPNERLRYSYLAEAQVFRYENTDVDLEQRYKDKSRMDILLTDIMKQEAIPQLTIEDIV